MKKQRCEWVPEGNQLYEEYHDREWGLPIHDDGVHFEFLILEGAQAGLSWETILKRREEYRRAFKDFDVAKVAKFSSRNINKLLDNPGIIRNRLKIKAAISNAQRFIEVQKEHGSFDSYIWQFVKGKPMINHFKNIGEIPTQTKESNELSRDLKKRGFSFVGPTIIYAHMQAVGLVNDHTIDCFRYREIANL